MHSAKKPHEDLRASHFLSSSRTEWILPVDDAYQDRDYREHEKNIDEPPYRIDTDDAQEPKDDEDCSDSGQHGIVLSG